MVVVPHRPAEQMRKETNSLRFSWHERLLTDQVVRKHPNALVMAGHFMHRFNANLGYAEVSLGEMERKLGMPRGSARRVRDVLIQRRWLIIVQPYRPKLGWSATRYGLGGGPDDLELTAHQGIIGEHIGEDAPAQPGEDHRRYR